VAGQSARERLVTTAASLFYAHGVHAVGVDRIVAESAVTKATLYQHFASKDDLVAACLGAHIEHWQHAIAEPARARPGSAGARVGALFDLLAPGLATSAYRGCPFINTAAEYPERDGPVAAALDRQRANVRALFTSLLSDLPAARRRRCTDQLVLLYDGVLVSAEHRDGRSMARAAKRAARTLVEAEV
jgi:AcrR family transcriptional regulator